MTQHKKVPDAQRTGRTSPGSPDTSTDDTPHGNPAERRPGQDKLPLPHERDQTPETIPPRTEKGPRQVIDQAASDIRRGLRDSERRGVPSDVPGPGAAPQDSPGAEVPPEGVDGAGYTPGNPSPARPKSPKH